MCEFMLSLRKALAHPCPHGHCELQVSRSERRMEAKSLNRRVTVLVASLTPGPIGDVPTAPKQGSDSDTEPEQAKSRRLAQAGGPRCVLWLALIAPFIRLFLFLAYLD